MSVYFTNPLDQLYPKVSTIDNWKKSLTPSQVKMASKLKNFKGFTPAGIAAKLNEIHNKFFGMISESILPEIETRIKLPN